MSVGLTGEEMSVISWFYKVDNLLRDTGAGRNPGNQLGEFGFGVTGSLGLTCW